MSQKDGAAQEAVVKAQAGSLADRAAIAAAAAADAATAAILRAHSQSHAELARRAKLVQRDTLSPAVRHELGLDRPSVNVGIRRNSSAPSLTHLDDGLPKIVIGICGQPGNPARQHF
jgi:hypothetical protein